MPETTMVDEPHFRFLSIHDVCVHAVRHVCEACRRGPRGLVWDYVGRLACKGDGAIALGDLCVSLFRFLANEIVDVAVGERLYVAGGD